MTEYLQLYHDLGWVFRLLSTSTAVLVLCAANWFVNQWRMKPKFRIPIVGKPGQREYFDTVVEGYKLYPDRPFMIPANHHSIIVLPTKYLDEVKSIGDDVLGFGEEVRRRYLGQYTGLGIENHTFTAAIRRNLTHSLETTISAVQDEIAHAVPLEIGRCPNDTWTPVPIYSGLLRIVARISGRVFVGLPLSRDEAWISIETNYTVDTFRAAFSFWQWNPWLRPLIVPFLAATHRVQAHRRQAQDLLRPIIKTRLAALRDPMFEKPNDLLQWALDISGPLKEDIEYQAHCQLSASLSAIHTTTNNISHLTYELVTRPEIVEPLREEVRNVLRQDDGCISTSTLNKMRKLDSFIRETQRFYPLGEVSMNRYVVKDLHLSDGFIIPKGNYVAFPARGINHDASLWENPHEFDAFRFSKLRDEPGAENMHQLVKTGADNLNFGHGVHACPGRFFASNEIKMLLSFLLLNYDMKLADGQTTRPPNTRNQLSVSPCHSTMILMRERQERVEW